MFRMLLLVFFIGWMVVGMLHIFGMLIFAPNAFDDLVCETANRFSISKVTATIIDCVILLFYGPIILGQTFMDYIKRRKK